MAVVEFDPAASNVLKTPDGPRWFVFRASNGSRFLLDGRCPHRGGPLALGTLDSSGRSIVCPWHDTKVGLRGLFRKAVPTVWRRDWAATAVVPEADGVVAASTRTGFLAESTRCGYPLEKHAKPAPSEWDGGEKHGD